MIIKDIKFNDMIHMKHCKKYVQILDANTIFDNNFLYKKMWLRIKTVQKLDLLIPCRF